jgi:hypothetical protein
VAYAIVQPGNALGYDPRLLGAKNVTGITRLDAGLYCVGIDPALGIDTESVPAQVTVNWALTATGFPPVFAFDAQNPFANARRCGPDAYEVATFDGSGGGALVRDDKVAFDISVP